MQFASWFGVLVAASECGPEIVKDGNFPLESRAVYKTYTEVDYADHFDITYASTFKVLNNFVAKEQYVLTMCNSDMPTASAVDKVAPLPEADFVRKNFTVPLKSYGSDSTSTLAFLDIIGVHDRQLYISQYATAPCLQKAMGCDATMTAASAYGDEAEQANRLAQIDETEGFFMDAASASPNSIAIATFLDPHMLNRAEWIKFVGAFFNLEDRAEKHMDEEEKKWKALSDEAEAKAATPLVAFIENSAWSGQYVISLAPYKTLLVAAAGGRSFATTDFTSEHAVVGWDGNSVGFDSSNADAVAAFQAAIADVDVFIDETYAPVPADYGWDDFTSGFGFDPREAADSADIFRVDGLLSASNGMDWFEGAFARPATVLADFVAAMHSTGGERTYLRGLEESPTVMTAEDCDLQLPGCDDVPFAPIESPCDRYRACAVDKLKDAIDDDDDDDEQSSASAAAALLLAAAALA